MRVLATARRRLRLASAARSVAAALWPLVALAWLAWLFHRFVHAITAWQVAGLAVAWLLVTAIVTTARLPTRRQSLVTADRAVGARSLLICALDARATERGGPAAERVARDAAVAAPRWLASLGMAVPVTWPTHGTVAVVALTAAALLLALPGAHPATVAQPSNGAIADGVPAPAFSDSVRALSRALAPAERAERTGASRATAARQSGAPTTDPPRADTTLPTPTEAPVADSPTRQAPSGGVTASAIGDGDAASTASAPPLDNADGAIADLAVTRRAIARRGEASTATGEQAIALGGTDAGDPGARLDVDDSGGSPTANRYRSPAMRGYVARVERLTRETRQ